MDELALLSLSMVTIKTIAGRQNIYLDEYLTPPEKRRRTFQAQVTTRLSDGYTIETVIDGKALRGVLFSTKTDDSDPMRSVYCTFSNPMVIAEHIIYKYIFPNSLIILNFLI